MTNNKKELGDLVESSIKKIAPQLSKNFSNCGGCKKRKKKANNFSKRISGRFLTNNNYAKFS